MDISEVEISLEMFSDFFFNKVFRTEDRQGTWKSSGKTLRSYLDTNWRILEWRDSSPRFVLLAERK